MSLKNKRNGFTLIELVVSIGLFSIIVLLTSGAYFMMISINRQAQGIATGINNLSFALETMARTIRTGTSYQCPALTGGNCSGETSFSVTSASGSSVSYALSNGAITQNGAVLTDPSVSISSLKFYASGTAGGDGQQPYVTIIVYGTVTYGPGAGKSQNFAIQTSATMRGTDI